MEATRTWFREAKKQRSDRLLEAKIVIVGAGESGKTTLINKLKNEDYPVPDKNTRTEGIEVWQWPFEGKVKAEQQAVTAHVWDFGGQEIYKDTHQFFLSPDTLYVLLNDNRKGDTDFYYWLNVIAIRAGSGCPILLVFNEKNGALRQISPDEELFGNFPQIVKTPLDVDFADGNLDRLRLMRSTIERHFCNLEAMGKPILSNWLKVRQDLKAEQSKNTISFDRFREICERHDVQGEDSAKVVCKTLHNLGVLLFYPELPGLEDLVILNPNWCLDAVYKVLDADAVRHRKGRFTKEELALVWGDPKYKGKLLQLRELMTEFELCYRVRGSEEYVAPQMLPVERNEDPHFPKAELLRYRYEYQFMPRGILTRFIARMGSHVKGDYVWRSGVTLQWGDTVAEVTESQVEHAINIRLHGPDRKRRLLDIRDELGAVHEWFRGLKPKLKEKIPCNCKRCSGSDKPSLFRVKDMETLARSNAPAQCLKGDELELVSVHQLLEGVFDTLSSHVSATKKFIEDGDLRSAIDVLLGVEEVRNEAVHFSGRLNKLEEDRRKSISSPENYTRERNAISDGLLSLLEEGRRWRL
ncbi:MAG: hypothetical protein K9J37_10655 [Saprospiraceae bacterium]|nr:hypothetical protein [Saprospiraceae bacterium]MCF8250365.1 hypothetical protein [Saprospiraceae bacterium]MCF8280398.1 hypothetical protein [Bacteroidales bacterium]MCF8312173.1 hypothetical protein [Saprospiraceae bacterium]MCF8441863.1 hypothetical protein [Saprospiraceae bacterium]